MNSITKPLVNINKWAALKQFVNTRIAHAKDAVYAVLNKPYLLQRLQELNIPAFIVHSNAAKEYLPATSRYKQKIE